MITLLLCLALSPNLQDNESAVEFAKEMVLNDSTNYVDIPKLGLRVIYPKCIQPRRPRVHRNQEILSLSIGSFAEGDYDNEINMSVEFATQNSIKSRSDSYKAYIAKDGAINDDYPPQTEQEYIDRKKLFINGVLYEYYDDYHMVGNRKYGDHLWGGPNIGTAVDSYTYFDSLQIKITITSLGDSLAKNVNQIIMNDFGLDPYINRIDDVRHQLIKEILYQKYLQILKRIQFIKL